MNKRRRFEDELIESSLGDLAGAACIGEWILILSWFWLGEFDVVCSTFSKWFEKDSISFKFKLFSHRNSSKSIFSTLKLELEFVVVGVEFKFFSLCNVVDEPFKPFTLALYNWSLSHKFGPRNADEFQFTFELNSFDIICLSDFTKK